MPKPCQDPLDNQPDMSGWGLAGFDVVMMSCDDTDVPTPKTTVRLPGLPNPRDYRETFVLAPTGSNPPSQPAPPVSRVAVCVWGWFRFRVWFRV